MLLHDRSAHGHRHARTQPPQENAQVEPFKGNTKTDWQKGRAGGDLRDHQGTPWLADPAAPGEPGDAQKRACCEHHIRRGNVLRATVIQIAHGQRQHHKKKAPEKHAHPGTDQIVGPQHRGTGDHSQTSAEFANNRAL